MEKYRFKPNSPRLPPPREHSNATTKAYAKPRDWSADRGDDEVYCYTDLHRKPVLRTYIVSARDWRLNPSVRPPRRSAPSPQ